MGAASRMSRADRFIKEFGPDYIKRASCKSGDTLTVKSVCLAQEEGCSSYVRLWINVADPFGVGYPLAEEGGIFDPEDDTGDGLIERVASDLNIDEATARQRLTAASLL